VGFTGREDFFSISPWDDQDLQIPLLALILDYLKKYNQGCLEPLYLLIDDSLANKDRATCKLEAVDWYFDHKCHHMVKASNHISLSLSWGKFYFPLLQRLYLRQAKVKKLNRNRPQGHKLLYQSKLELAQQMLEQVQPFLPPGVPVYVLFDSWYTSSQLVRWIRHQQWQVIAGIKSNRKLTGQKVSVVHRLSKGLPYEQVRLGLANGNHRTYWVRVHYGRLRGVPDPVNVVISQKEKGPGQRAPRYFLCIDTQLTAQEILQRYQKRWAIETDYWQVKMQLGLGDYRLQSYEAIAKWYTVVYLVLAYLYWRKYEEERSHGGTISLSEILQATRWEHHREVLCQACTEVSQGTPIQDVLDHYLGV